MAKVTITIEDAVATGGPHLEMRLESDPPLPIATVTDPKWLELIAPGDKDLDVDQATQAQLAARMAVGELMDSASGAAALIVRDS